MKKYWILLLLVFLGLFIGGCHKKPDQDQNTILKKGQFLAAKDGKYGLVDLASKETILPFEYALIGVIDDKTLLAIHEDGRRFLTNYRGEILKEFGNREIHVHTQNKILYEIFKPAVIKGHEYLILNREGEAINDQRFNFISGEPSFSVVGGKIHGLLVAVDGDENLNNPKNYMMNLDGSNLKEVEAADYIPLSDKYFIFYPEDANAYVADENFNRLFDLNYKYPEVKYDQHQNLLWLEIDSEGNFIYGLMKMDGTSIIESAMKINAVKAGYIVNDNHKLSVYKKDGKTLNLAEFLTIDSGARYDVYDGALKQIVLKDKILTFDQKWTKVVKIEEILENQKAILVEGRDYVLVVEDQDGLKTFTYQNKEYKLNFDGEINNIYKGIIEVKKDDKKALFNLKGECLVDFVYDQYSFYPDAILCKTNSKWGILDYTGKLLVNAEYDNIFVLR